jgi:hypothetical protein
VGAWLVFARFTISIRLPGCGCDGSARCLLVALALPTG